MCWCRDRCWVVHHGCEVLGSVWCLLGVLVWHGTDSGVCRCVPCRYLASHVFGTPLHHPTGLRPHLNGRCCVVHHYRVVVFSGGNHATRHASPGCWCPWMSSWALYTRHSPWSSSSQGWKQSLAVLCAQFHRHMVDIICCRRVWASRFKGCCDSMFITYKMKTIHQLKKEEIGIKTYVGPERQ
jgi:hypothetical protein